MKKGPALFFRLALCAAILLVDLVVFFLPISAFFLVYILLFNPPWFRRYLDGLSPVGQKKEEEEDYKDYFLGP